jgi:hypothetical protein
MNNKTEQTPAGPVEHIVCNEIYLATIVRADFSPSQTTFVTPDTYYQQCGFVVYPKDGVVKRHLHLPIERHLVGTPETIILRKGRIEVELYNSEKQLFATRTLKAGDVILLAGGGHKIRSLEDSVMMEIKQGPYTGLVEKEIF